MYTRTECVSACAVGSHKCTHKHTHLSAVQTDATLARLHSASADFLFFLLLECYFCVMITVFLVFATHHPLHHLSAISKCCVLPHLLPFFGGGKGGEKEQQQSERERSQYNKSALLGMHGSAKAIGL